MVVPRPASACCQHRQAVRAGAPSCWAVGATLFLSAVPPPPPRLLALPLAFHLFSLRACARDQSRPPSATLAGGGGEDPVALLRTALARCDEAHSPHTRRPPRPPCSPHCYTGAFPSRVAGAGSIGQGVSQTRLRARARAPVAHWEAKSTNTRKKADRVQRTRKIGSRQRAHGPLGGRLSTPSGCVARLPRGQRGVAAASGRRRAPSGGQRPWTGWPAAPRAAGLPRRFPATPRHNPRVPPDPHVMPQTGMSGATVSGRAGMTRTRWQREQRFLRFDACKYSNFMYSTP